MNIENTATEYILHRPSCTTCGMIHHPGKAPAMIDE